MEPTERSMPPVMMTGVIASGEQSQFDAEAEDFEEIYPGEEFCRDRGEDRDLGDQSEQQNPFAVGKARARRVALGACLARNGVMDACLSRSGAHERR